KWSRRQILALGTRTDLPTAGSILAGLSETASRELWRRGEFPVPVLAVGRRLVVPVQPILDLLGLGDGGPETRSPAHDQARGDLGDGTVPIVVVDTGDGLRSVWVFHDALRSQLEKLQPQPGDVIAIRYNGKQISATGRTYHSYTVATDRPRTQYQWGSQPEGT